MPRANTNEMYPVTVAGIPAFAMVTHYHHQAPHKGSPRTCDSDWDFYGYTELEFDLYDRKGYRAAWLEKKDYSVEEIEQQILEAMKK